ncbi:hypothetical protein CCO02nite_20640 [Cellulomonas composti]|uniref:Uncharacterized protein n=2 Tax=Cellulomonas composti TaxID=266130 RepID=A0A511JBP8_9CELL|nr:hypothetical protein CCO02nite_20640 [Cellulomonas composti]
MRSVVVVLAWCLAVLGLATPAAAAGTWSGSVSLVADASELGPAEPSTYVRATVSPATYPSATNPYVIIYDSTTGALVESCLMSSTACSTKVSVDVDATRSFSAYVTMNSVPNPGPPSGAVVLASSSTAVHRSGWTGSLTLVADEPTLQADKGSTYVRAIVNPSAATNPHPYVTIGDAQSGQLVKSCLMSSIPCSEKVSVGIDQSRSLVAYVTDTCCSGGRPTSGIRASAGVAVKRSGWHGSVSLAASVSTFGSAGGKSLITATIAPDVNETGLITSIYNAETHTRVANCSQSLVTCSYSANIGAGAYKSFIAFVAKDAPSDALPSVDIRASSGRVVVTSIQIDAVEASPLVISLATLLVQKYGDSACLTLGAWIPSHRAMSSVPDVTLVCNAKGIVAAIRMIATLDDVARALQSLIDTIQDDVAPIEDFDPDCYHVSDEGICLDEGTPDLDYDPEPGADGGIDLPGNCIKDPVYNQNLLDSLPTQKHHLATDKSPQTWTPYFEEIIEDYPGLTLNQDWNLLSMPHRGRHPNAYHQWVLENMELAQEVAGDDADEFLRLFAKWVREPIENNPLAIRGAWWRC